MSYIPRQSIFQVVSSKLSFCAKLLFAVTVILIPMRYRITLLARPMPPLYSDYTDFLLFASDIGMLSMLIFWIISLFLSPRKLSLGPRHIWIPLAGLTIAGGISSFSSFDPSLTVYHTVRLIALFWFYVFIVNEIHTAAWILIPVGLQVVSQSIVAMGQSLTQSSLGVQALGEYPLNPAWSGISILENGTTRFLRAYGLSDHPNILGGCLAFGLILLLAVYIYSKGQNNLTAAFGFTLGLTALFLTFSRSAWLAFSIGAVLLICIAVKSLSLVRIRRIGLLIAISILMLAPFIWADWTYIGVRFNAGNSFNTPSVEQQSIGERFLLLEAAEKIFITHPLIGVGLGAAPIAMKQLLPGFSTDYQPPHFNLLAAATETGIFGATFYLLLILLPYLIVITHRNIYVKHPIMIGASTLLLSVTVVGFFDYYTWLLVPGRLWQFLAWGVWAVSVENISV